MKEKKKIELNTRGLILCVERYYMTNLIDFLVNSIQRTHYTSFLRAHIQYTLICAIIFCFAFIFTSLFCLLVVRMYVHSDILLLQIAMCSRHMLHFTHIYICTIYDGWMPYRSSGFYFLKEIYLCTLDGAFSSFYFVLFLLLYLLLVGIK